MAKRQRHTPEQIISKLREAEVRTAKETAIAQLCKDLAITEVMPSDSTPRQCSATYVDGPFPTSPLLRCRRIDPRSGRLPSPVITSLP
jgi:hypothetical protein